jgi:hypothetical protein
MPRSELAPLASLGKLSTPGKPGAFGPEGVPVPDAPQLAAGGSASASSTIDGIRCQGAEQIQLEVGRPLVAPVRIGFPAGL